MKCLETHKLPELTQELDNLIRSRDLFLGNRRESALFPHTYQIPLLNSQRSEIWGWQLEAGMHKHRTVNWTSRSDGIRSLRPLSLGTTQPWMLNPSSSIWVWICYCSPTRCPHLVSFEPAPKLKSAPSGESINHTSSPPNDKTLQFYSQNMCPMGSLIPIFTAQNHHHQKYSSCVDKCRCIHSFIHPHPITTSVSTHHTEWSFENE